MAVCLRKFSKLFKSVEFYLNHKKRKEDFTMNRKLPFKSVAITDKKKYPYKDFKKLYYRCWRVETLGVDLDVQLIRITIAIIALCFLGSNDLRADSNVDIAVDQTIALSSDDEWLAVSWEKDIHVFDLKQYKRHTILKSAAEDPFTLVFSPNNKHLLSSGWEMLSLWEIDSGTLVKRRTNKDNSECAGFSADGKSIYFDDEYTKYGDLKLVVTDLGLKRERLALKSTRDCNASVDRKRVAIATYTAVSPLEERKNQGVTLIDLESTKIIGTLYGDKADPYDEDLFFFDNNRKLVIRDYSKFHVWNAQTMKLIKTWDFGLDVDEIAYASDTLLLFDEDKLEILIWKLLLPAGKSKKISLDNQFIDSNSLSVSKNGKQFAITSTNKSEAEFLVSIYTTKNNALVKKYKTKSAIFGSDFIAGDSKLLLHSYPIKVLDIATGKIHHSFSK